MRQLPRPTLLAALALAPACFADCPGWDRIGGHSPAEGACVRLEVVEGPGAVVEGDACPTGLRCVVVLSGDVGHVWANEAVPGYADETQANWEQARLRADGSCPLECPAAP